MRIAIDATSLLDTRTGVGNVTAALIEGLAHEPGIAVTAFPVSLRGRGALAAAVPAGIATATPALPARVLRTVWRHTDHPRIDRFIGRHDLVHGPNFVTPPSRAARLATVHDLTAVRFPELCHPDALAYPRLLERMSAAGGWIHTVSHAVRAEVVDILDVDAARVVAVPNGFTPMGGGDAAAGRRIAGLDHFAVAVGTVEPRKDLPGLLRAIDAAADDGTPIDVVHVGGDGWGTEAFEAARAAMRHPERIHRLGRRSDTDLRNLLAAARLFVYPSVYEGFGLPVLEAMSAGVPVVSTEVGAIVEVAGGAAHLVTVGDADALAGAMVSVWSDGAQRSSLIEAGTRQAARYSWSSMTAGIVDLYRRIVAGSD